MTLDIHPGASQDAQDAYDYYYKQDPAIAEAFVCRLEATLMAILDRPASFPPYRLGTRRALLQRFPYQVVFHRAEDSPVIRVLALAHAKRREGYWTERL